MTRLTRDLILNCDDIKTETMFIPEWNGEVTVKAMTGAERDALEASMIDLKGAGQTYKLENMRAKMVAKTVIDPDTKQQLFSVGDIDALGKKSAAALDRIFEVSQRLSKFTKEDVDVLVKN